MPTKPNKDKYMPRRLKRKTYELLDATVVESKLERVLNLLDKVQYFSHIWEEEGCSPPSLKGRYTSHG